MSTIKQSAKEITEGLNQVLPDLNKPVVRKLSLAVGAMIEGRTPNTTELRSFPNSSLGMQSWKLQLPAQSHEARASHTGFPSLELGNQHKRHRHPGRDCRDLEAMDGMPKLARSNPQKMIIYLRYLQRHRFCEIKVSD